MLAMPFAAQRREKSKFSAEIMRAEQMILFHLFKKMLKPKKSLGQNFLKSEKIAQEIVEAGEVCAEDVVLEVGPGEGVLTVELLKKAKKVIAVEKDEQLAEFLKEKFAKEIKNGKLEIVSSDILKFNASTYGLQPKSYKLIANIPYYITSHLLRTFLESDCQPSLMVLMVQKEVAERIVGVKTKESILSVSVKAYGDPEIIRKVPASYFSPAPKVDSAVIKIANISKVFFQDISEEKFFETVKKGFSQKRKMLINNLKTNKSVFTACNIAEKARSENLSLSQWKCLTFEVK